MEVAVTLVEFEENDEHSLKVSDEALKKIENIPKTFGIKTVAIVGPGRIGKSSLLNWFVRKSKRCFFYNF
jgi:putative ribosome biogenesis GTPase RsgA